jgi:hypothetical protein
VPDPSRGSALSLLTFREVRSLIRRSHAIAMTVFFGLLYAIGSMVLGDMLVFTRVPGPSSLTLIWSAGSDPQTWNFPALVYTAPWGYISLPFLATWVTVLVSVGVAMGTSSAILLAVQLVRRRRTSTPGPTALGGAAGLTPAMLALVTLGACCGTTAAATAGIGVVAQITGTSTANLLYYTWFLGIFQVAVVWIALLGQELLLRVYGEIIGVRPSAGTADATYRPPVVDRRFLAGALLRAALLIAGVSWALAMLVQWTTTPPSSAPPALWASWILQYEVLGVLAILAALFPQGTLRALTQAGRPVPRQIGRGVLLIAGLSLALGTPPPISGWGFLGFGNELIYTIAGVHAVGAIAPVFAPGLALYLRWVGEYLFLGGFAVAVALRPDLALRPLTWTTATRANGATSSSSAVDDLPRARPPMPVSTPESAPATAGPSAR